MKKITPTEEVYLHDQALFEDRKFKKLRIGLLLINVCCALLSTYHYVHYDKNWRELGAVALGGMFFLGLFWKVSLPYKLKRMINQDLSFKKIEEELFEKSIQIKTFKDLNSQQREEMMIKLTNEQERVKKYHTGSLRLRECYDNYDIIANILIHGIQHDIINKDKTLINSKPKTINRNVYYSELLNRTQSGIKYTEDYLNGLILLDEKTKRQQYLTEKRKVKLRKNLPYFIAIIGIVLLFLLGIVWRELFV